MQETTNKSVYSLIVLLIISTLFVSSCNTNYKAGDFVTNSLWAATDYEGFAYFQKMVSALEKDDSVFANEIFRFDFSKAYVFDDYYISGEYFAKQNNLDISIEETKESRDGMSERIVFVDENGDHIFTFICHRENLIFEKYGLVIYPNTKISKCTDYTGDSLKICFDSQEYYYKSIVSENYTDALIYNLNLGKTLKAYNIFHFGYIGFSQAEILENKDTIVFYDKDGIIMYEYNYDSSKICFEKRGIVFYPDSVIKKCESEKTEVPTLGFYHS